MGRRRKSQHPRAPSLLGSGRAASVKEEAGDEGHMKPAGCKMMPVHHRKPVGRGHSGKYGKDSRCAYIMPIAHKMKMSPNILVSVVEGRLFHNVFNHLVDAIVSSHIAGSDEKAIEMDMGLDGRNSIEPLVSRECLLKKILTLLLCMACRRHYDAPSDSEVVYYRELKRHIRCVIAYHEANGKSQDVQCAYSKDPAGYHSVSCSQTISAIEELIELISSLAESSPQFQELSQNNAHDIAIHVRMDFKSPPEPNWSAEKTGAFYYNKLIFILHDLKCSGLVGLSPQSNERKCINTLLDYVTSVHLPVKKESEVCDPSYAYEPVGATTQKRGRVSDILMDNDDDDDFYPIGPVLHTTD